jgi:peptide/nickel transport system substrate-binding protein
MKTLIRVLSILLVLTLALSACAPKSTPVERPVIILASDQPGSADPAENWTFGGAAYLPHIYDGLFRYVGSTSPKLTPLLATEIPTEENGGISDDGMVYTIKLRHDASFHDGSPVNADAVVYSYERIKALQLGANGITADWAESIEKVDEFTVKFTLSQPFADFLNSMGSVWGNYIVNPVVAKANEQSGDWGHAWLMEHDAGSGPYVMASVDPEQNTITLERYNDYWGATNARGNIDTAIIRWGTEPASARSMLEKGDADAWVNPQAPDYTAIQALEGMTAIKYPSIMQYYLALNGSIEPLTDPKVRQALQYTFNTDTVISDIFNDTLTRMEAAVGPGYPDVYAAATQYTYDLEKAKTLLKEAGYENGFELTANMMGFFPNDAAVLEYWQADLAKVGITLTIQEMDGGVFGTAWFTDCTADTSPNIGQVSALGVGGDYPSAWEVAAQVFPVPRLGGAKCSAVYIDDARVNELFTSIAGETSADARAPLFQELYDTLAEDAGAIWIGQALDLVVYRNALSGYEYYFSMGGNYLPLDKMTLN